MLFGASLNYPDGAERSAPSAFHAGPPINTSTTAVISPCIGVCTLDVSGYCMGCLRTGDEIGAWLSYSEQQRLHWVNEILPQREAERDAG